MKGPIPLVLGLAVLVAAPDAQVFRASTDVVEVDVAVRAGKTPVKGLTAADFELIDNGVKQSIDAMVIEEVPVDLTLILDVSPSTVSVVDRFRARAQQIAAMLRQKDQVRLITFATDIIELVPFRAGGEALKDSRVSSGNTTSLHDALLLSLMQPPVQGRRRLIVAFSDGVDTASVVDAATVSTVASRAESVLHIVLAGYPGQLPPTAKSLRAAAEETGGDLHLPGEFEDAVDGFKRVFEDFRQSYVLRYTLSGVPRYGWHDITVKLTRQTEKRYTVRAKRGYFGG